MLLVLGPNAWGQGSGLGIKTGSPILSTEEIPMALHEPSTQFAPSNNMVLSLDGAGDYVDVDFANYNFSEFTMEAWINVPTYGGNSHYVSLYQNVYIIIGDYSSGVMSSWASGLSPVDAGESTIPQQPTLGTNEWHHLALSYNGSHQYVYIDGMLVDSVSTTGTLAHDSIGFNQDLNIGSRYTNSTQFVTGYIDEVRIWNVFRDSTDIQSDMLAKLDGNETGLLGYWNFDDGTANDVTANANDGVLTGDAVIIVDNTLMLNPSVTANFIVDVTLGDPPLTVNFTDLSNATDSTNLTSWEWDFDNDGSFESTDQNPSHIYTDTGTYSVTLVVSDSINTDTLTMPDLIQVVLAEADFSADTTSGFAPLTVNSITESPKSSWTTAVITRKFWPGPRLSTVTSKSPSNSSSSASLRSPANSNARASRMSLSVSASSNTSKSKAIVFAPPPSTDIRNCAR